MILTEICLVFMTKCLFKVIQGQNWKRIEFNVNCIGDMGRRAVSARPVNFLSSPPVYGELQVSISRSGVTANRLVYATLSAEMCNMWLFTSIGYFNSLAPGTL